MTQERKKLDEERQQLREDEEALETQMREMEVGDGPRAGADGPAGDGAASGCRAEIQHELELMQRGDAHAARADAEVPAPRPGRDAGQDPAAATPGPAATVVSSASREA